MGWSLTSPRMMVMRSLVSFTPGMGLKRVALMDQGVVTCSARTKILVRPRVEPAVRNLTPLELLGGLKINAGTGKGSRPSIAWRRGYGGGQRDGHKKSILRRGQETSCGIRLDE